MVKYSQDFIKGIGKSIDLRGRVRVRILVNAGPKADAEAMRGDWRNVGIDIQNGIQKYGDDRRRIYVARNNRAVRSARGSSSRRYSK